MHWWLQRWCGGAIRQRRVRLGLTAGDWLGCCTALITALARLALPSRRIPFASWSRPRRLKHFYWSRFLLHDRGLPCFNLVVEMTSPVIVHFSSVLLIKVWMQFSNVIVVTGENLFESLFGFWSDASVLIVLVYFRLSLLLGGSRGPWRSLIHISIVHSDSVVCRNSAMNLWWQFTILVRLRNWMCNRVHISFNGLVSMVFLETAMISFGRLLCLICNFPILLLSTAWSALPVPLLKHFSWARWYILILHVRIVWLHKLFFNFFVPVINFDLSLPRVLHFIINNLGLAHSRVCQFFGINSISILVIFDTVPVFAWFMRAFAWFILCLIVSELLIKDCINNLFVRERLWNISAHQVGKLHHFVFENYRLCLLML